MAWGPITVGGENFSESDFAPFAFAANWQRLLAAFAQHLTDTAALAGVQTATITGTGHAAGVTTYTYTSPVEPPDGGALWLDIPETPQGTVSLARDGGATRTLRNSSGTVLGADQLTPGRLYLAKRVSGVFELVTFDLTQWLLSRVNMVGATATIDGRATRAGGVLSRIGGFATGALWGQVGDGAGGLQTGFWVYENGNAAGRPAYQVWIPNDLRVDGGITIGGFTGRVNMLGVTATLDGRAAAGDPVVSRLSGWNSGSLIGQVTDGAGGLTTCFYAYGAGNSAGRPTAEFRTLAGARIEGNLHVVGSITSGASAASTAENPASTDSLIQLFTEFSGVPVYESLAQAVIVANTHPHQICAADGARHLVSNVADSFIDAGDMLNNSSKEVDILTSSAVRIWTGTPGVNWRLRAQEQVRITGGGRCRIFRGQGNRWEIEAVNGTTIADADLATYPLPVYARTWPVIGYSNVIRANRTIGGARDQFLAWGENPSINNIISGVGASCFLRGGESGFDAGNSGTWNHWWNWETGTPGPNIAVFLAAVAAAPALPAPEFVIVHLGYPDMNLWEASRNPLGAALTEAQMVGHWHDALEYTRGPSGLNIPTLKFVICPMAHRHVAVWPRRLWYALRRMQVQLCADHPDLAVRGPDSFDLRYIPNDSHPTLESQRKFSARWARWLETIAERKSAFLGPEVVTGAGGVIFDSATQTSIVIDPGLNDLDGGGNVIGEALRFPGQSGNWLSAPLPAGIALLPAGADYITDDPIEITDVRWSYNGTTKLYTLRLTHASQASNPRFCWPYGFMNETGEDPALCIRSLTTGEPLATYHPDVPLPKYLP